MRWPKSLLRPNCLGSDVGPPPQALPLSLILLQLSQPTYPLPATNLLDCRRSVRNVRPPLIDKMEMI